MRRFSKITKIILIGGLSSAAITACAPASHMSGHDAYMQAGYGYSQMGYGSSQAAMTTYNSRYGGQLRGACHVEVQTCGFMQVVPVYPIYQYVSAPHTPDVPTIEEPPVVIYEPAPEPVYIPEPVQPEPLPYVPPTYIPPIQSWPDPETPPPSWTPLRK